MEERLEQVVNHIYEGKSEDDSVRDIACTRTDQDGCIKRNPRLEYLTEDTIENAYVAIAKKMAALHFLPGFEGFEETIKDDSGRNIALAYRNNRLAIDFGYVDNGHLQAIDVRNKESGLRINLQNSSDPEMTIALFPFFVGTQVASAFISSSLTSNVASAICAGIASTGLFCALCKMYGLGWGQSFELRKMPKRLKDKSRQVEILKTVSMIPEYIDRAMKKKQDALHGQIAELEKFSDGIDRELTRNL